jgi:chromosome partitioning protein
MAEHGAKVAVLDMDNQANASFTLQQYSLGMPLSRMLLREDSDVMHIIRDRRESDNLLLLPADPDLLALDTRDVKGTARMLRILKGVLQGCNFDYVLVDTGPALGARLAASLMVADCVISPIELEIYSIQGISLMLTTIRNVKAELNPRLSFLGMLPSRVDNRNPRHQAHLEELRASYKDLLIPHSVSMRSSIADALATRQPVWRIKKSSARPAAREMRAVAAYITEQINRDVGE